MSKIWYKPVTLKVFHILNFFPADMIFFTKLWETGLYQNLLAFLLKILIALVIIELRRKKCAEEKKKEGKKYIYSLRSLKTRKETCMDVV